MERQRSKPQPRKQPLLREWALTLFGLFTPLIRLVLSTSGVRPDPPTQGPSRVSQKPILKDSQQRDALLPVTRNLSELSEISIFSGENVDL